MSDPVAKAERSRHKDLRQMGAHEPEQRPFRRRRKSKPYAVLYRYLNPHDGVPLATLKRGWRTWGRYASESTANNVMDHQRRKNGSWIEFKLKHHV